MNTTGRISGTDLSDPDFKKVLKLDSEQFPRPWSEKDWPGINWDHHLLYIYKIQNEVSGFAFLSRVPGDDTAHLLKICLETALRGSGEVQLFWKACLENLKKQEVSSVYLEVEATNLRAIGFYQKSGFKTLRLIKNYYSDGADALTMAMTI